MSLRLILMIIGALIIAAILLDGYRHWRRAKKQNKMKRVVDVNEFKINPAHQTRDLFEEMPKIKLDNSEPTFDDVLLQQKRPVIIDEGLDEPAFAPLADEPKITTSAPAAASSVAMPEAAPAAPAQLSKKEKFLVLHVLAQPQMHFSGEDLSAKFAAHGLYYGPMHIFHKYENQDGSGAILFSVANAFEPGTLNLDYPESFYTRGLTFFMQLPNKGDPEKSFETMLHIATLLAKSFNAKLCDHQRQPLTVKTAQEYREEASAYHLICE